MDRQKEMIMRFSRMIYVFLKISFIVLTIVGVMMALAWLWSFWGLHTEVVSIAGTDWQAPLLFKLGDVSVYLPIMWKTGAEIPNVQAFATVDAGDFFATLFTLIGIRFAQSVFYLLRTDGSPFRADVVKALKKLAIALIVAGCMSGAIPLLMAAVVWVLSLIFEYGCALQNESDTTL